jgi:hypothetical protein
MFVRNHNVDSVSAMYEPLFTRTHSVLDSVFGYHHIERAYTEPSSFDRASEIASFELEQTCSEAGLEFGFSSSAAVSAFHKLWTQKKKGGELLASRISPIELPRSPLAQQEKGNRITIVLDEMPPATRTSTTNQEQSKYLPPTHLTQFQ